MVSPRRSTGELILPAIEKIIISGIFIHGVMNFPPKGHGNGDQTSFSEQRAEAVMRKKKLLQVFFCWGFICIVSDSGLAMQHVPLHQLLQYAALHNV